MLFTNFKPGKICGLLCGFLFFVITFRIEAQTVKSENELTSYLNSKDSVYENICIEFGTETWDLYSGEGEVNLYSPKSKMAEFLTNNDFTENIYYWVNNVNLIQDDILKRKVVLWDKVIEGTKIELDKDVKDIATQLLEKIRTRDAKDTIQNKELEKQVLNLIKIRNKKARELGYDNYAYYILDYFGIGYKWFESFAEEIDKKSAPVYKELLSKIKREKDTVKIMDIMKYYKYPPDVSFSEDSNYVILRKTMSNIGFDYDALPIRFVVKAADFGGNCIGVVIPTDYRVIVVPNMPISVYMHELGHGLQGIYTNTNTGLLEGYEWCLGNTPPMFYEGMADMMAGFTRDPKWLKKYSTFSDEEISEYLKTDKYESAVKMRLNLFVMLSEIEVYKNEDKIPNDVVNALFKKIYMIDENRSRPYSLVSTAFVDYPCYMQNYVIADFISWQVHQTLKEKFGESYAFNKEVKNYLIENFYKYGVSKDWRAILTDATGRDLDIDGYLNYLGL
ncbi:MAG TPA: M3 family metallopeptidase [Ignavibacteria bacterium]